MPGTDTLDRTPTPRVAARPRAGEDDAGWAGPEAVTVVPGRRARHPVGDPVPSPPRRRRGRRRGAVLLTLVLGLTTFLTIDGLAPSTTPTPAPDLTRPTAPPSRVVDPSAAATAEIGRLLGGELAGHVSVAARDVASGRSFGYEPDTPIYTASVVKLDILATLLLQGQDAGRLPTDGEQELARPMMQQSDNDAASSLWEGVGGVPAIATVNRRLGIRDTRLDDHWGTTTTSAADQLALLGGVTGSSSLLGPEARAYAHDLMTHVADDQRWGVSAAADPGTTTALKNGWMPLGADDGRWVVGSVGMVTVGHRPVLLAVLTEHQPSRDDGIALVEALSRIAARAVA